jgi:hypothetical protein
MNTHVKPPGEAQDALYLPTDITPEEVFQAIGRLRKEARDEIHRLILFLDKTDDYVSRELEDAVDDGPCDDAELEPSLCGVTASARNMPNVNGDDLEGDAREDDEDGGDREPDVDDEPSLCGITAGEGLAGGDRDLEGDDSDREPSLGWPENRVSQSASPGNFDDREQAAEPGRDVVQAAYDRPSTHYKADASGGHVDIDDSCRIGTRLIRNLSAKQKGLLAPRIDRGEVRL